MHRERELADWQRRERAIYANRCKGKLDNNKKRRSELYIYLLPTPTRKWSTHKHTTKANRSIHYNATDSVREIRMTYWYELWK